VLRIQSSSSASLCSLTPGAISSPVTSLSGDVAISSRPCGSPRQCGAVVLGGEEVEADRRRLAGSADLMWMEPVLSERSTLAFMVMPCRLATRR